MESRKSTRVRVLNGDRTKELGPGTLVGTADVWVFPAKDGSLWTTGDPEQQPTEDMIAKMLDAGCERPELVKSNPRILLDDGNTVYGCQVWWAHE